MFGADHSVPDYRLSIVSVNGFKGNDIPILVRALPAKRVSLLPNPDGREYIPGTNHGPDTGMQDMMELNKRRIKLVEDNKRLREENLALIQKIRSLLTANPSSFPILRPTVDLHLPSC